MIKITVDGDKTCTNAEGNGDDVIIEAGFALYDCIEILKECGKSDAFIEAMFHIALKHQGGDTDD